jgi:hypothetical protein
LPLGSSPRWAVKELGTALGFEPGITFERTELTLYEGDTFILYTDGVTEAFNPHEECYGSERLLADASELRRQSASAITNGLLQKVRAFAGNAPQSDDIAILALKVLEKPSLLVNASSNHQSERFTPSPPMEERAGERRSLSGNSLHAETLVLAKELPS